MLTTHFFRSPLSKIAAEKSRDTLAKGLYDKLFSVLMQHINRQFSPSASDYSIGILDIAGFGGYNVLPI